MLAERMVLEEVVKEKNVEHDDVRIRNPSLIYIPKWLINIESKKINCRREVFSLLPREPLSMNRILSQRIFMKKDERLRKRQKRIGGKRIPPLLQADSSGIGYEISVALARNAFLTYATMRNLNKSENIKSVATKENLPIRNNQLDVIDDISVKDAVQAISSETGRIDVLVNNAGYVLSGAFEDLAMDEIKTQYDTNVFGLIRTTQAVLPIMRRQKSGIIVNISSGAGKFGYPGQIRLH